MALKVLYTADIGVSAIKMAYGMNFPIFCCKRCFMLQKYGV